MSPAEQEERRVVMRAALEVDPRDVVKWGPKVVGTWHRRGWTWMGRPDLASAGVRPGVVEMSLIHLPTGIQVFGRSGPGGLRDGRCAEDAAGLETLLWDDLVDEVGAFVSKEGLVG